PERMTQIMQNLLSNALKNVPSGGSVFVKIEKDHSNNLVIHVVDDGYGIPQNELPKIFDRFYQVEDTTSEGPTKSRITEGTGIGLALTKELVHLLGGTIRVISSTKQPGNGTTFTLIFPVRQESRESISINEALHIDVANF